MASYTTKKPTGISIARNGLKFVITWKIGDANYGASQELEWAMVEASKKHPLREADKKWHKETLTKTQTQKTITIDDDYLYPNKDRYLGGIKVRIRGKRSKFTSGKTSYTPSVSAWAEKTFNIDAPSAPTSLGYTLTDNSNIGIFSWAFTINKANAKHYKNLEFQTAKAYDFKEDDLSKAKYGGTEIFVTGTSKTIQEDTSQLVSKSLTRLIRVRTRGIGGPSAWVYKKHVYAMPKKGKITSGKSALSKGTRHVVAKWTQSAPKTHPVDTMDLQYAIATPETAGLACPNGASWTSAVTVGIAPKDTTYAAEFNTDANLDADQCMWLRVHTNHDRNDTYSDTFIVDNGGLPVPKLGAFSASGTTLEITTQNNSAVPDSKILVAIKIDERAWQNIAVLDHSAEEVTSRLTCPDVTNAKSYQVAIKAGQGKFVKSKTNQYGAPVWTFEYPRGMESEWVYSESATLAKPPENLTATAINSTTARLTWDWSWTDADMAEITWADHEDAWESTEEPESYMIEHKATAWNVGRLSEANTYFFRVRLLKVEDDETLYSPWSDTATISLAETPTTPSIATNGYIFDMDDTINFTVGYTGNNSVYVEVVEIVDGNVLMVDGQPLVVASSEGSLQLSASIEHINNLYTEKGLTARLWTPDSVHLFSARVSSQSGKTSDTWSDSTAVMVVPDIAIESVTTNLVTETSTDEEGNESEIHVLKSMPLTIDVVGAGEGGITQIVIERDENYDIVRPDESKENNFAGEIVATTSQLGEAQISIDTGDLIGKIDDGARYNIIATIMDNYEQTATQTIPFTVAWTHQPEIPVGSVEIDEENAIAKITVTQPAGYVTGDTFDLYRISVDKPELILKNGTYGTTYVDPYPALNDRGGHRIVNKTINGDYITEDNTLAWLDFDADDGDIIEDKHTIIDFDGHRVVFISNMNFSNTWEKDFQKTSYLGGSVTGDWNPAVTRTMNFDTAHITIADPELIHDMRLLAEHTGICHIRTPDGSSFACDIQVSENHGYKNPYVVNFSMTVTRVDSQTYDAVTLERWEEMQEE